MTRLPRPRVARRDGEWSPDSQVSNAVLHVVVCPAFGTATAERLGLTEDRIEFVRDVERGLGLSTGAIGR